METLREILKVPTHKIGEPWETAFSMIQKPLPGSTTTTELQEFEISLLEYNWDVALHFVFRKWVKKHKIPLTLKPCDNKAHRLFGEYLRSILEICIQCHAVSCKHTEPYANAAVWFSAIVLEMKQADLKQIFDDVQSNKAKNAKAARAKLRLMFPHATDGSLPTNPHCSVKEPHRYRLIQVALTLSHSSDDFPTYWQSFKKATTTLIRSVEGSSARQIMRVVNGRPKISTGQGRGLKDHPGYRAKIAQAETVDAYDL